MSKHAHEHLREVIDANSILCDQLNLVKETNERLKKANLSLKAEISYLNDQNERLSNQLKGLRQKNEDLNDKRIELENKLADIKQINVILRKSDEEVEQLKKQNADLESFVVNQACDLASERNHKGSLEEEYEKLKKEAEALRYENKALFDRNHAFNEKIAALERENEDLKRPMHEAFECNKGFNSSPLTPYGEALEEIDRLRAERDRLTEALNEECDHEELEIQPAWYSDGTEEKSNFIIECRRNWDDKQAAAFYNTLSMANKIALCEALGVNCVDQVPNNYIGSHEDFKKIKQFYVEKIKNA